MLQRIQTIFLLGAGASMLMAALMPLMTFFFEGSRVVTFYALGITFEKQIQFSTWPIFTIGAIATLLSLITIFLYKKRVLQIRITIFNIILTLGFYAVFFAYFFMRSPDAHLEFHKVGFGLIMPFIAIIFDYMAIRKIGADEFLIRSLNRIR